MSSIEYVGHIIDQHGIHFAQEKLDEVLNFAMPVRIKDLQRFIGMVNYFGDHIQHLATELRMLREMEQEFRQHKVLQWTQERKIQFERIKSIVKALPQLYFLNDHDPVRVYTDASEYAVGGYVCQVVDGKEKPIGFMSKTLKRAERRWTTTERECYAIYMTLRKFEYLIRDIPFKLYTDHENLKYLNVPPSNKVLRWKLAIQEYNFKLNYIKGENNVVADGFSRLTEEIPSTDIFLPETAEVNNQSKKGDVSNMYSEVVGNAQSPSPSLVRSSRFRKSRKRRQDIMVGDPENGPDISVIDTRLMVPNISSSPSEDFVNVAETSSLNVVMAINTVDGTPVRKKRNCNKRSRKLKKPNDQENPNPILINLADSDNQETDNNSLEIVETNLEIQPESDNSNGNPEPSPICKTDEQQFKWFTSVHNAWLGHRGLSATLEMLNERGCVWTGMRTDVADMIMKCPTCQKLSVRKLEYQTHPFITSTYRPHECINVDTLVLNQVDKHGNTAVIVVIDTFTRWIELYPIPDYTEQQVAALKLLEHFGRYGPPKMILTDRSPICK